MTPKHGWPAVAALAVLLIAALTYPGAVLESTVVGLTPPRSASGLLPGGTLPWLHVEHPRGATPFIADDKDRMVLLHGAIPGGLVDYWSRNDPVVVEPPPVYPIDPSAYDGRCPANSPTIPTPPLCEEDLTQMAALGFNSLRLPLSWSLLEPERGRFSQTYLDRAAQVVDWARTLGMYVIIDMHQNAYSRFVGPPAEGTSLLRFYTGAPAWATYTDGLPSHLYLGQREANPAVFEAATNFWYDRAGIQDEYIKAIAFIAQRFKDDSAVAGYSVFNEPLPGWNLPPGFEDLLLFPFYRRVIDAITGVGDGLPCWTGFFMPAVCGYPDLGVHDLRHLVFLDTGLDREVTDFPTHLGLPVSSYPNLVLGMHAYTHLYTFDKLADPKEDPAKAGYPWGGYDQSYWLAEKEAKAMGAALFVAEFGNDPHDDPVILANQLIEQEKHRTGFAFWTWKENGGEHTWGVYDGPRTATPASSSGCLRPVREALLARVYPRASSDAQLTYHYDPETGAFTLRANGRAGDPPTVVYIPRGVGGDVVTSGAVDRASIDNDAQGAARLATVFPSGGDFTVTVNPSPVILSACS